MKCAAAMAQALLPRCPAMFPTSPRTQLMKTPGFAPPHIPQHLGGIACLALLGVARFAGFAQDASTNAPPAGELDTVVVRDVPIEDSVMPTARPVTSVLGDERSIVATPRSVTLVTRAQMETRNISRTTDFQQLSPGVYTPSRYGLAGVPVIRGDLAEIYQNGQRTIYSRNSILPSFNGVEAMDIVKGPGSAVYGPQGQAPGGYVNLVTKAPYFDQFRGEITTKLGTYVPGGQSYFNPEWIVDVGGPLSDKLAYRVSYLGREAEGYYQNTEDNTFDLFAALTYRPSDKLTLDWTAQFYTSRFNEVIGINRVTQELIDDHVYNSGPVLFNAFGQPIDQGPFFGILAATNIVKRKVYGHQTINAPFDSAHGHKFNSQLIATYQATDDLKIINRTYGETQETSKLSGYGYTEFVPDNWMVNNRTEFHFDFDAALGGRDLPVMTISGLEVRHAELLSYQDFSTEPFFIYDVTQPASTFILPGLQPGNSFGGGFNVPGEPGYGGNPFPSNGNQDSRLTQLGFFTQWDMELFERFSIIAGGRGDYFMAEAESPVFVERPGGALYSASANTLNGSVFLSGIYKWTPSISTYVTYNLVNAVQGSANFGGVDGTGGDDGLENSLSVESELIEAGAKASLLDDALFLGVAVFRQDRSNPQLIGPAIGIETTGVELEAFYQPTRNFNASANFTYLDAKQDDFGYQQTFSYLDGYEAGYVQDGRLGTGVGSPNYNTARLPDGTVRTRPSGKIRAASVPRVLFNAYATYQFDFGLGASFGPQVQGEQWQNQEGSLTIPAQFVLNAAVFYRQPKWEVQINFFNLTDERNWTSIDPSFAGNDVIYPEQPFRISGLIKYRF